MTPNHLFERTVKSALRPLSPAAERQRWASHNRHSMRIDELFPKQGAIRSIYCDSCSAHLDLGFIDFAEDVSGVAISVSGLPVLVCPMCAASFMPDRTRVALIELHRRASEKGSAAVTVRRNKTVQNYGFTQVPFIYDSDDYNYIPGLVRTIDEGFLTPLFFNREVLLKYDAHPSYRVAFASRTYGGIRQGDDFDIPFGINRNGRVVMWLGDVARLPEPEQYYLRSENVASDHSIGSEFYDGQIECKFTNRPPEDELFRERSELLEACFKKVGEKIAHLESEVLDLAASIRRPIVDTPAERRAIADALNKVYIESLDNKALGRALTARGQDAGSLGTLKRLQKLLEVLAPTADVSAIMAPLYALYDLRVAYSHLGSVQGQEGRLKTVHDRLRLPHGADLFATYDALLAQLTSSLKALAQAAQ